MKNSLYVSASAFKLFCAPLCSLCSLWLKNRLLPNPQHWLETGEFCSDVFVFRFLLCGPASLREIFLTKHRALRVFAAQIGAQVVGVAVAAFVVQFLRGLTA